jgi:uncharacterized membrane protein
MKRNGFYILFGIVALLEVVFFWISLELGDPRIIQAVFILGLAAIYLGKRQVTDVIEDERTALITQKASMRTLEIFWVVFFLMNLGTVVAVFGERVGLPPLRPPPPEPQIIDLHPFGYIALIQMALLCLMVLLYVGFRIYYARQYGDWEDDEE